MSTKMKAFIGITVSFVFLIILFTATGGYRAARASEDPKKTENTCSVTDSVEEKVCESEAITQVEAK